MVAQGTGHRRKLTVPLRSNHRPAALEVGQSTVEFVALLPVLLLVALVMGQAAIAGYAAWSAAGAARVAARAQALGADPQRAIRPALPAVLLRRARVTVTPAPAGEVTVRLRVPSIVPGLRFGTVKGRAQLPSQVGT